MASGAASATATPTGEPGHHDQSQHEVREPAGDGGQGSDWLDARLGIELLAGKWTLPTLHALHHGPCRNRDLARALAPEITPKMLQHTLRRLERQGLLTRDDTATHPAYSLTPLGASLHRAIAPLAHWSRHHRTQTHAAS